MPPAVAPSLSARPPVGRVVLALLLLLMGVLHFTHAGAFASIMPRYLPAPLLLVHLSGAAELAIGAGLLVERTRRLAAWAAVALFVAVFPANLNMALHPEQAPVGLPAWLPPPSPTAAWLRLPLQGLLVWWAFRYTRADAAVSRRG